jgi:hypothetical protein
MTRVWEPCTSPKGASPYCIWSSESSNLWDVKNSQLSRLSNDEVENLLGTSIFVLRPWVLPE